MMKMVAMVGALALGLGLAQPAAARQPIEGRWLNPKGTMTIEIAPCGPALCGTVLRASERTQAKAMRGSGTTLIGSKLLTGLVPIATNRWRGRVYLPDRDMHASGTMRLLDNGRLQVSGCLLGVICKNSVWRRA